MTVDQIFYTHIKTNLIYTGAFRYANAAGSPAPYIVMIKIVDPELRETLCDTQGDQGEALFQFSGYTEGGTLALQEYLNTFKIQVAGILGEIGTGTDKVLIWDNNTEGVRMLNGGQSTEVIAGAFFETTIKWRYV